MPVGDDPDWLERGRPRRARSPLGGAPFFRAKKGGKIGHHFADWRPRQELPADEVAPCSPFARVEGIPFASGPQRASRVKCPLLSPDG